MDTKEIYEKLSTHEGIIWALNELNSNDGGNIEPQIIIRVVSGVYTPSMKNAIIDRIESIIASHSSEIEKIKNSNLTDSDGLQNIYEGYIRKSKLTLELIKLCFTLKSSENLEDKLVLSNICAVLSLTSLGG